jgi:Alr-MurF fusion protein
VCIGLQVRGTAFLPSGIVGLRGCPRMSAGPAQNHGTERHAGRRYPRTEGPSRGPPSSVRSATRCLPPRTAGSEWQSRWYYQSTFLPMNSLGGSTVEALSIADLVSIVEGSLSDPSCQLEVIRNVTIHSGQIMHGSVFFALPGTHVDGHAFAGKALENGAVAVIVAADKARTPTPAGRTIEVDDPLMALHRLAKWWRSRLQATVVAVVGGSGKTVTKDAITHILGAGRKVYGSPGSFNSKIGVPLALLDCPADSEVAVIEAAATEVGEMRVLCDMIRPDHAVFTNLGTRHASNFPGPEAHAQEFMTIVDESSRGWLIVGDLQSAVQDAAGTVSSRVCYRGDSSLVPVFKILDSDPKGSHVHVSFPDGISRSVAIQTPFEEILIDVEIALAASWLLGVGASEAILALTDYTPTATRMEVWQSPEGWTVIRDVATTDALTLDAALRTSSRLRRASGRLSVVLSDVYDSCSEERLRALGRTLAISGVDSLWALERGSHAKIGEALREAGAVTKIRYFSDLAAMSPALRDYLGREDVVLIESPRERSLAEETSALIEPMASTRLFIDRLAIESNVLAFRRLVGAQVQLLAMVKGLAYGTNAIQVSRVLQAAGIDYLGVATVDEGAILRRADITLPILVTLATPTEMDKLVRYNLTPQIYSEEMLDSVISYVRRDPGRSLLNIHLEVDTGMHRTGFLPADAIGALRRIKEEPFIRLAGMMTHFASADDPGEDGFTRRQLLLLEEVADAARELGFTNFIKHAANTAGTIRFPEARLDMVRIGIGMYGIYPGAETGGHVDLTPVVALVSQIVEVQELPGDDRVGYGGTYTIPATGGKVAVVAAGYHDCIPRAFSNFGYVVVDGRRCPIRGSVSMDSMVIDVTDCPWAAPGSDVLIYGRYGGAQVSIEEVAAAIGTIPYELLARVGPRVQRVLTQH